MKYVVSVLAILAVSTSAFSQSPFQTIEKLQDIRTDSVSSLVPMLKDTSAVLRERCALALANIGDSSAVPALIDALNDPNSRVRYLTAFALGQIGGPHVPQALLARYENEREMHVLESILDAIGKTGDTSALTRVIAFGDTVTFDTLLRAEATAIARFAVRKVVTRRAISRAFDLTSIDDPGLRGSATYALMRMSPFGPDSGERGRLRMLSGDAEPFVRMSAVTALGKNDDTTSADMLGAIAAGDPDWRVRVNALRAIGLLTSVDRSATDSVISLIDRLNEDVSLTALSILPDVVRHSPLFSSGRDSLRSRLEAVVSDAGNGYSWRQQGSAAIALSELYGTVENSFLLSQLNRSVPRIPLMLKALAESADSSNLRVLSTYAGSANSAEAVAALEAIPRLIYHLYPGAEKIRRKAAEIAGKQLLNDSPPIAGTAADALSDTMLAGYADRRIIAKSAAKFEKKGETDVLLSILHLAAMSGSPEMKNLLERYTGNPVRSIAVAALEELKVPPGDPRWLRLRKNGMPAHTDFDWELLDSLQKNPTRIRIETSKGSVIIRLYPFEAPFTSILFIRLMRSGFYRHLTFHRVVPNFVVQGGDPLGTGWGGPGFTVRTEISPRRFDTGTVGMASAGKDTEGSQFFITQSPQPHLDGRYTIFGQVEEGMDVVDRIQMGDEILDVVVEK